MNHCATAKKHSLQISLGALGCILLAGCTFSAAQKEKHIPSPVAGPAANIPIVDQGHGDYMTACRSNGVPVPPDWKPSSSEWQGHGSLATILLTPNDKEKVEPDSATFAHVWSYASPAVRGACLALGRNSGTFQVICQSAETGHACFWGNDPGAPTSRWSPETSEVKISSLGEPERGFASGTVPCTECHRGTNAFLIAPDDPTWAKVLRPGQRGDAGPSVKIRPTFTVRVEQSTPAIQGSPSGMVPTRPRFTPIGGRALVLTNPLPTTPGCSGDCHESHFEILEKGHTPEGYVRAPRPMGPACARNSPANDPAASCYDR